MSDALESLITTPFSVEMSDSLVPPDQIWMVVIAFIIAFVLAFGIGANDVANSFGTSVGAKVLTLKQACILASIFETLGAIFLGAKVSDTIRKGIIDVEPYQNQTELLMVGNVAALSGSCVWLIAATLLRLPVSATHSIVGATVGFALVAHGAKGINWTKLGMIIGSWFISPVLAGLVSAALFFLCKYFILMKDDPLEPGLRWLPVFYSCTIVINFFSIFYDGPEMFHFDKIPLWGVFVLAFGSGVICAVIVKFIIVPWQRKRITAACAYKGPTTEQVKEDEIKFKFRENSAQYANSNSKENSCELGEKAALQAALDEEAGENEHIPTVLMNGAPNIKHPDAANNISDLNEKNLSSSPKSTGFLSPHIPVNTTPGKILEDISNPNPAANKPKVGAGGKICKHEDAPLMDNEYKLGTNTPMQSKAPTTEHIERVGKELSVSPPSSKKLPKEGANGSAGNLDVEEGDSLAQGRSAICDRPETARLFSFLQILTAVFGAFAHGGNDVSNAIGPLVSIWLVATTGQPASKAQTPIWILLYGGVGISIGLWAWGRRVIKTIGEDLTKITPSSGFCIEIGSALTVLIASNIGIPISTTHCKVGSVVFVGRFRARENVDWSIFRNIVLAWLVTLPIAGGISAAMMAGLRMAVPH